MLGLLLLLAGAAPAAAQDRVRPEDYRQFWLWSGAGHAAFLDRAETLYVLQGFIGGEHDAQGFAHQGVAPFTAPGRAIFLAFRLRSLDWSAAIMASIRNAIAAWERGGAAVAGIQLDFDARTPRLADYASFLERVRSALPAAYRLSVTGLLDWSTGGTPAAFDALSGTVDEIVFQTYRGRATVANYRDYLRALVRLRMPFKIGLVEGGQWDRAEEQRLAASPFYRGAVVFLPGRR